jgi:hypothetical protein
MTQFMLCVVDPKASVTTKLALRGIEDHESWLQDVARALFPGRDVRVPQTTEGVSIGDMFTEAHNALYNGGEFNATLLQHLLTEVLKTCKSFALWWGDDWQDLPVISTEAMLLSELKSQLAAPIGDVYLLWNRDMNDRTSPT